MRLSSVVLVILILGAGISKADTGPTGFAVGFGPGVAGMDFSDGTTRTNIGGLTQMLELGLHTYSLVFLLDGKFMSLGGGITDYVADGGFSVKWYFLTDFFLRGSMGYSQFRRTADAGLITTVTTHTGGYVGGLVGWDFAGAENTPFRLSLNVGATRHEFGSRITRQGTSASEVPIEPKMTGMTYYWYLGLSWYL